MRRLVKQANSENNHGKRIIFKVHAPAMRLSSKPNLFFRALAKSDLFSTAA
jgi:hypothetical protein